MRPKTNDFRDLRQNHDREATEPPMTREPDDLTFAGRLAILSVPPRPISSATQVGLILGFVLELFLAAQVSWWFMVPAVSCALAAPFFAKREPHNHDYRFTDAAGNIREGSFDYRTVAVSGRQFPSRYVEVEGSLCTIAKVTSQVLARSEFVGADRDACRRTAPEVGDTFDVFLADLTPPDEPERMIVGCTFGPVPALVRGGRGWRLVGLKPREWQLRSGPDSGTDGERGSRRIRSKEAPRAGKAH